MKPHRQTQEFQEFEPPPRFIVPRGSLIGVDRGSARDRSAFGSHVIESDVIPKHSAFVMPRGPLFESLALDAKQASAALEDLGRSIDKTAQHLMTSMSWVPMKPPPFLLTWDSPLDDLRGGCRYWFFREVVRVYQGVAFRTSSMRGDDGIFTYARVFRRDRDPEFREAVERLDRKLFDVLSRWDDLTHSVLVGWEKFKHQAGRFFRFVFDLKEID